jgi:hypothetical protein
VCDEKRKPQTENKKNIVQNEWVKFGVGQTHGSGALYL